MPDEAIYAERGRTLWQEGTLPLLHGPLAGYGVLYPVLSGLPLSIGSIARGYAELKVVQSIGTSLVAIPIVLYGRRLMPTRYALVAAALALASPLVLYSGMVMTEALFYPLAALITLAVARAVETATLRHQAIAVALIALGCLTRAQAAILLPAFALAVLLDAVFTRDRSRLRAFWPIWALNAVAVLVVGLVPGVFGAYSVALSSGYPIGAGLRLSYEHLAYVAVSTALAPFAALTYLLVESLRGRMREPGARALVAVTTAAVLLISTQVGFFSARFPPSVLLGRYLAALPPLLFLCFGLWLSWQRRRSRAQTLVAFGVLALIVFVPWNQLNSPYALPDTFGMVLIQRYHSLSIADTILALSLVGLGLFALALRRLGLVLAGVAFAFLVASSAVASNEITRQVRSAQTTMVGPVPDWVDRATHGSVTYLYNSEIFWNAVWQELFWNEHIKHVVSIWPTPLQGPVPQTLVTPPASGRLPTADRYIVTPDRNAIVGTPIAHLAQTGLDVSGLTLWRVSEPARLSSFTTGIDPQGNMSPTGTMTAYDCGGGQLQLTLLPKATRTVRVLLNGQGVLTQSIAGLKYWNGTVYVPPSARPETCVFTIEGQSLLGSTIVKFVRR